MTEPAHPGADPTASVPPRLSRRVTWAVIAIIVVAALLRLWNIGSGIPYNVAQDEPEVMNRVVNMMKTGDFHPHFFDWPTLTFYLNLVVTSLAFLAGSMRGAWSHLDQVSAAEFYVVGRCFTALLGTITVALTFAVARRWGSGVALLAGALMAVMPGHVRESHFVLTDVPTALFTTLALLLTLRAAERPSARALGWAGFAVGLAASCKYNGAVAILMPLVVAWTSRTDVAQAARRTGLVIGLAAAGFVLGSPYAVLDLPFFLNEYAGLAEIFARPRPGDSGWVIYPKLLAGNLSWPAALAATAGVGLACWRVLVGPNRVPHVLLLVFGVPYFAVMAGSYQVYGRYLLPLYPVLSVLAASATLVGLGWVRRRIPAPRVASLAAAAIVVAVLAQPAASAVSFGRAQGMTSTADLAHRWILEHVPAGSVVAVEAGVIRLAWPYSMVTTRAFTAHRPEEFRRDGVQYFVVGSPAFQAALADPRANAATLTQYREVLDGALEIAAFDASRDVSGPSLRIFQVAR